VSGRAKWYADPQKAIKQATGWRERHDHLYDVYAQNERGARIELEDAA
jgi:hypothetical protein